MPSTNAQVDAKWAKSTGRMSNASQQLNERKRLISSFNNSISVICSPQPPHLWFPAPTVRVCWPLIFIQQFNHFIIVIICVSSLCLLFDWCKFHKQVLNRLKRLAPPIIPISISMDLLWPVTHFIEQPYYWADVAGNWVFGWMVGWVVGYLRCLLK